MISSPGCECRGRRSRIELDDCLDDLASGDAQVVALQIGTPGSHLLRQGACNARAPATISATAVAIRFVFMSIAPVANVMT